MYTQKQRTAPCPKPEYQYNIRPPCHVGDHGTTRQRRTASHHPSKLLVPDTNPRQCTRNKQNTCRHSTNGNHVCVVVSSKCDVRFGDDKRNGPHCLYKVHAPRLHGHPSTRPCKTLCCGTLPCPINTSTSGTVHNLSVHQTRRYRYEWIECDTNLPKSTPIAEDACNTVHSTN